METETEDILVPIPDEDLPELAEIYKKYINTIPHIFSAINTLIKLRKCEKVRKFLSIYSPNNNWKVDGAIIILMEFGCYNFVIFTLDKNSKALLNGLTETKKIDFKRDCAFYCLHYDHLPIVLELIKIKQLRLIVNIPNDLYLIKKENALKYNLKCPADVYVKKLDGSDISSNNFLFPPNLAESDTYFVEFNGCYGLFMKPSNHLIACITKSILGQVGILKTYPLFARQGYASFLTKYMSKEIAEEGYDPTGTVAVDSVPGQNLSVKLGFKSIGFYAYVEVGQHFQ